MEVWYGCAGVSSGITSIGVRQDRAKSRDMPYTKSAGRGRGRSADDTKRATVKGDACSRRRLHDKKRPIIRRSAQSSGAGGRWFKETLWVLVENHVGRVVFRLLGGGA